MQGPFELRRYIDLLRRRRGKRNGVIPSYAFDDLTIFKLQDNDKRREKRRREPVEE